MDLPAPLLGKRVLVVEDDFLLATDLCRGLADLGATVLGPAPTPFYALSLLGRRGVDAAVLDIRLHGTDVFDVAKALVSRSVPIIFATAWSAEDLPLRYQGFPVFQKPIDARALHAALGQALLKPEAEKPKAVLPSSKSHDDPLMRAVVRALRLSLEPGAR
jgi:DNA-binding response OmpR family regulator